MSDENDSHFLFAIAVIFGLALAVLAYFCGEEFMKILKIILYIGSVILAICVFAFLGILFFAKPNNNDTKTWFVYSSNNSIPEDTEKLLFLQGTEKIKPITAKKLRCVGFDSSELSITADTFVQCKNIEEIILYQKPGKEFNKDSFAKCTSLRTVTLVGNNTDWKDFEITVPQKCEIKFFPTKTVIVSENNAEAVFVTISK